METFHGQDKEGDMGRGTKGPMRAFDDSEVLINGKKEEGMENAMEGNRARNFRGKRIF